MGPSLKAPLSLLAVACFASALPAQDTAVLGPGATVVTQGSPPIGRALAGAVVGGVAGALVGGVTGGWIGGNHCVDAGNPDSCYGIAGVLAGSAIGFTLGTPVGAHLMNRRMGSLPLSLGASVAWALVGAVAFNQVDKQVHGANRPAAFNAVLITVPVLQIATSALVESRSSTR